MRCNIGGSGLRYSFLFMLILAFGVISTIFFTKNTSTSEYLKMYGNNTNVAVHLLNYWHRQNNHNESHNIRIGGVQKTAGKVRVLCWVMTHPPNHKTAAKSVKETWGKRCDTLLFMSSTNDTSLPTVALPVGEGRNNLWAKTKHAFKYVYENYMDKADWFMKADDDTYVIVENLRYMLSLYNTSMPLYLGCHFKPHVHQSYMSGGAGYILSKEALRRLVEEALPNEDKCRQDNEGAEDVEIGKCLENVKVKVLETRDDDGYNRFSPFSPDYQLSSDKNPTHWYWKYIYNKRKIGLDCCSNISITFHYISPKWMYTLDYLIYKLKRVGATN